MCVGFGSSWAAQWRNDRKQRGLEGSKEETRAIGVFMGLRRGAVLCGAADWEEPQKGF